jgi:hypothetical protein
VGVEELLLAAAICHAGIAALPGGIPAPKGLAARPENEAVASVPVALLTDAGFGVTPSVIELLLVGAAVEPEPEGGALPVGFELKGRPKELVLVDGVVGGFIRCPISIFKLFSSVFNSRKRVSVVSFWPSMALGINSLRPRTSSVIRCDSSSRLLLEDLSSLMTLSTSVSAVSKRSVRACSDALRASVSFASWSRRANAFSKDSSIACLSCWS